jgi:hypothetical protein
MAPLIKKGLAAVVIADDIVKYPNAACSQQSIVGMELFQRKQYQVRKVVMFDEQDQAGHFAYEVNYDGGWHFFDTNQEPDSAILNQYNRPSAAFLAKHPEIVAAAYRKRDPEFFQRLLISHEVGPVDTYPAPRAYLFQVTTKFLTNFGWAVMLLAIFVRKWIISRKFAIRPRVSFAEAHPKQEGLFVSRV